MRTAYRRAAGRAGRRAGLRGFTLVELMIAIAIVAILATMAVPSFNEVILGSKLNTLANNFVASAHLARSEAIKRNKAVTLCVSGNGTSCTAGGWEQGWIILADSTVVQRQEALPTGMKATGSVATLDFQPSGVGSTAATITICRLAPTVGKQERVVTISATGRPGVAKTTTGSCS